MCAVYAGISGTANNLEAQTACVREPGRGDTREHTVFILIGGFGTSMIGYQENGDGWGWEEWRKVLELVIFGFLLLLSVY